MLTFPRQRGVFRRVSITGATRSLRNAVQGLTHAVLSLERAPWDVDLHIDFVSTSAMRDINWQTRGVGSVTDVLTLADSTADARDVVSALIGGNIAVSSMAHHGSMPSTDAGTVSYVDAASSLGACAPTQTLSCVNRSVAEVISPLSVGARDIRLQRRRLALEMGTVYVCVEYMWHRCRARPTRNLSFQDYVQAALVHGLLHALGYNHDSPTSLSVMVRREQWIGRQLAVWQKRFPDVLCPLDGIGYLHKQHLLAW